MFYHSRIKGEDLISKMLRLVLLLCIHCLFVCPVVCSGLSCINMENLVNCIGTIAICTDF